MHIDSDVGARLALVAGVAVGGGLVAAGRGYLRLRNRLKAAEEWGKPHDANFIRYLTVHNPDAKRLAESSADGMISAWQLWNAWQLKNPDK
jgi:hypothetical protein